MRARIGHGCLCTRAFVCAVCALGATGCFLDRAALAGGADSRADRASSDAAESDAGGASTDAAEAGPPTPDAGPRDGCVAIAEACNGADDDCDGMIDEGLSRACSTACGSGVETCIAGAFRECTAPPAPAETCNGRDDDCDGAIDDGERVCPCAVRQEAGRTYLLCTARAEWATARDACSGSGYELATIDSAAESAWITATALALSDHSFWIGLNDRAREGTFVWAGGSASTYRAWGADEPERDEQRDCVAIAGGRERRERGDAWRVEDCGENLRYVCELP